jgi:hypothetical protein
MARALGRVTAINRNPGMLAPPAPLRRIEHDVFPAVFSNGGAIRIVYHHATSLHPGLHRRCRSGLSLLHDPGCGETAL